LTGDSSRAQKSDFRHRPEAAVTRRPVQVMQAQRSPSAHFVVHALSATKLAKVRGGEPWLLDQLGDIASAEATPSLLREISSRGSFMCD
jgi:hypothetical protein